MGVAGGVGGEGGGERGERRRRRREGEERRALLRLLFLGEGGRGALTSSSPLERRGKDKDGSRSGGEQEGKGGVEGNERDSDADGAKEKDAMQSFVSFPSEKETKPRPLPLLISLA